MALPGAQADITGDEATIRPRVLEDFRAVPDPADRPGVIVYLWDPEDAPAETLLHLLQAVLARAIGGTAAPSPRGTPSGPAAACSRGRGSRSGQAGVLLYCRCESSSRTRPPSRRPTTTSLPPRSPAARSTSSSSRLGSASATRRLRSATGAASPSTPSRRGSSDAHACASRSRWRSTCRAWRRCCFGVRTSCTCSGLRRPSSTDCCLRPRVPTVFTAHDLLPRRTARKLGLWRELLSRFDRVVVHSERGRESLAELGVDATVIPHPSVPQRSRACRRRAHAPQSRHDPTVQGTRRCDRGDKTDPRRALARCRRSSRVR